MLYHKNINITRKNSDENAILFKRELNVKEVLKI